MDSADYNHLREEEDLHDDDDDVYLLPQGHYEDLNNNHLRIQSNFSEVDYPDINVMTPGSTNTSILLKNKGGGGIKSPPSQLRERQLDLMTDDLRRSIERLDKVIVKSQMHNQAVS